MYWSFYHNTVAYSSNCIVLYKNSLFNITWLQISSFSQNIPDTCLINYIFYVIENSLANISVKILMTETNHNSEEARPLTQSYALFTRSSVSTCKQKSAKIVEIERKTISQIPHNFSWFVSFEFIRKLTSSRHPPRQTVALKLR